MKSWFFPSWSGDFRLVEASDGTSQLLLLQPTPAELQMLQRFMTVARRKKWTKAVLADDITTKTIALSAPIVDTGAELLKAVRPKDRTLTAISFKNGQLEVAENDAVATLAAKAAADNAAQAVSVARPTPCCPRCEIGAIAPARDVLLSFLSPAEHDDWAAHRAIMVTGGMSGHRYLLAHRNSRVAALNGKICYDIDDGIVLHFHASDVPPEEEILAAKLILEHREPWLRNEATVQQQDEKGKWYDMGHMRYKNPFGGGRDGTTDAAITSAIGHAGRTLGKLLGVTEN